MNDRFDGIVIGAGHHGLILQAYLVRAGLRVLAVDRSANPGGGLATVENPRLPGFLHNTHSFFHRGITAMPWYRDLELARHGAEYIEPELNVAVLCKDGRSLQWWRDTERTLSSVASFSRRDARVLRRWIDTFRPIVEEILLPEAGTPPPPEAERNAKLERSAAGRKLLEVSAVSPLAFVEREFESEVVRAGLLFSYRTLPRIRGHFHHVDPTDTAGVASLIRRLPRRSPPAIVDLSCGVRAGRRDR